MAEVNEGKVKELFALGAPGQGEGAKEKGEPDLMFAS
jgi:hypothetical protein